MLERNRREADVIQRWLRVNFQIGIPVDTETVTHFKENTRDAVMKLFSPKQKRKFESALERHIAELHSELKRIALPSTEGKNKGTDLVCMLDEKIVLIEQRMQSLENMMREKTDRRSVPPHIFDAFEVMRINSNNPYKNLRRNQEMMEREERNTVGMKQFQFMYAFDTDRTMDADGDANFNPQYNIVILKADFDPDCLLDLFHLYHELVHVCQFGAIRPYFTAETWDAFYNPCAGNFLPLLEVEALALQLEAMNIMLDGMLKKNAYKPINGVQIRHLQEALRAPKKMRKFVEYYLMTAQSFYPRGIETGEVERPFAERIVRGYVGDKKPWRFDATYGLIPMHPQEDVHILPQFLLPER